MDTEIKKAIDFIKNHEETVGQFTVTRFQQGEISEIETKANYRPVLEWLEKFPKYFRSFSLKSGRLIIANILYTFSK